MGANIGYYAIMEAKMTGPTGTVIGVEPSPANVDLLRKNIALNGLDNVTVLGGAVSDVQGARDLFVSAFSNLNTFHPTADAHYGLSDRTISVTTHTIPSLAATHGTPTSSAWTWRDMKSRS